VRKPKKVNFDIIPAKNDAGEITEPYRLLAGVRKKYHRETEQARIALAWRKRLKADNDGHLVLGRCVHLNDLQRELVPLDFVILLNKEVWESEEFDRSKKLALLDHEMCHAAVSADSDTGETIFDEAGRPVFRIRKHDIEEFMSVVTHHGCYKRDLERFGEAVLKAKRAPMFAEESKADTTTVSIGMENPDTGEMEFTELIPHTEFVDRCNRLVQELSPDGAEPGL
jgi:hypothetical protein